MSDLKKRITNLLRKLRVDENSVLFANGDTLNKKRVKKILKSRYAKDKVLHNLYSSFVKNGGKAKEFSSKEVVLTNPFTQENFIQVTQIDDVLHTIDGPMQLIHAEFYLIYKLTYDLDVGRAFYAYLSETDTEIFTTIEKFNDPEGNYKGVIDCQVYPNRQITTLDTKHQLNVYTPKTFGDILKKDNENILFDVLVLIKTKHSREVIYRGIKDNVTNYGLKTFHTEYEPLDNEHWDFNITALQETIQPLTRSLFPLDLKRQYS